jgi:hypothetical protein
MFHLSPEMVTFLAETLAGLSVAALVGIFSAMLGSWRTRHRYQRLIYSAPYRYAESLERLILRAKADGPEHVHRNARAIVSVRNDLANSLISVGQHLDG